MNENSNLEKLKQLTGEIDSLIESNVNPNLSQEFQAWHLKAERLLIKIYGKIVMNINDLLIHIFHP